MSVTGAEQLNEKFDALSARFDLLKSVPKDQAALINAAISDWQDFYWAKYGSWPSEQMLHWQDVYVKTASLLDAVAARTVVVSTPQKTDDYRAPQPVAIQLPPLLVTAKPPPVPPPAPYIAPAPVLYNEQPVALAPVTQRFADVGTVDVSGWSSLPLTRSDKDSITYDLTPHGWDPPRVYGARGSNAGLAVAMGAAVLAIMGKRYGWL